MIGPDHIAEWHPPRQNNDREPLSEAVFTDESACIDRQSARPFAKLEGEAAWRIASHN